MKTALITFYREFFNSTIYISNGFSFFRHMLEGEDLFISTNYDSPKELKKRLESYDKVYCSVHFAHEFEFVRGISDSRWVMGGSYFATVGMPYGTAKDLKWLENNPSEIIYTSYEKHVGVPISNTFTDYWHDKMDQFKNPHNLLFGYSCSLGLHCYWDKCKFCFSPSRESYYRKDLDKIFQGLKKNPYPISSVLPCIGSIHPFMLKYILDNANIFREKHIPRLGIFARSDKSILSIVKDTDDTSVVTFLMGLEFFSDKVLSFFNKGFTVKEVIDVIDLVTSKGSNVVIFLMGTYPFLTQEIVDDYRYNLSLLTTVLGPRVDKLLFNYNHPIIWPVKNEGDFEGYEKQWDENKKSFTVKIIDPKVIEHGKTILGLIRYSGIRLNFL